MKERPILFTGEMVRAILAGRKTQTRRTIKLPLIDRNGIGCEIAGCEINSMLEQGLVSPHGKPGDRLWVKETFRITDSNDCACYEPCSCRSGLPVYRASQDAYQEEKWKPSIFMPRKLSRITLEVIGVHAERLQDISEEDAKAEGIRSFTKDGQLHKYWPCDPCSGFMKCAWVDLPRDYATAYRRLWEKINGKGSWDKNPWVWVIEFKKL